MEPWEHACNTALGLMGSWRCMQHRSASTNGEYDGMIQSHTWEKSKLAKMVASYDCCNPSRSLLTSGSQKLLLRSSDLSRFSMSRLLFHAGGAGAEVILPQY